MRTSAALPGLPMEVIVDFGNEPEFLCKHPVVPTDEPLLLKLEESR